MVSSGPMPARDNRLGRHRRADFAAAVVHGQGRTRGPKIFVDVSQGDRSLKCNRNHRASDLTDVFITGAELVAGTYRRIAVEQQSTELSIDVAARTDTLDDFLTEIAAFTEAHGVIQGDFKK